MGADGKGAGGEAIASVYIHAPFCARRCFYCDFAVTVDRAPDPAPWLEALRGEFALLEGSGWAPAIPLETLYVGGGTPSLLGERAMAGIAALFGRERLGHPTLEWTVEANPESLTPAVVTGWREAGVNRLSLGVQSFQPEVLRWMGRLHGADGARRSVEMARDGGITNLSVDLIFGLPQRLGRQWSDDLEAVLALGLPHVSLYGLTAEGGTGLGRAVGEGRELLADPERYREEFLEASERLVAGGYEHYEVSNFALPGMRSRHNAVYWSGRPWIGMGNSAHAFRAPTRRWNLRDWAAYRSAVAEGRSPVDGEETLDAPAAQLERIWLELRMAEGLPAAGLSVRAAALVERWRREGWSMDDPERVRLTPEGWLLLDELTVELDRHQGPPAPAPNP